MSDPASTRPRPPATSSLLATAAGLLAVALLFREISSLWAPAAMGAVGVLALAGCFELTSRRGGSPARGFLLGLLTIPVGIGFIGGIVGTAVILVGSQFPVPRSPLISVAILRILGGLSVVMGCTIGLFGLALGRRNSLTESTLRSYARIAFVTASAPVVVGLLLFVRVALVGRAGASKSVFGQLLDGSVRAVVAPTAARLHLGSFLFVLTIAGCSVVLFARQVPLADLLGGRNRASVARLRRRLVVAVGATALLFVPAVVVEAVLSPGQIETAVGPGTVAAVQTVTTARLLRVVLLAVAGLALGWVVVDSVLRQALADDVTDRDQWVGPFAAGGLLTLVAAVGANRLFGLILRQTTTRLPVSLGAELQRRVLPVVSVYGETAVIVLLAGVLVALAGFTGASIWAAVSAGYLTDEGAGFSLAASGLFFAAIGAVVEGGPTWLVLGSIAASLAVWDIGTFGSTLAAEVGNGATRSVELLHASATLVVGFCAVVAAVVVLRVAPEAADPSPTTTLALVSFGVGIVALSLAVRAG